MALDHQSAVASQRRRRTGRFLLATCVGLCVHWSCQGLSGHELSLPLGLAKVPATIEVTGPSKNTVSEYAGLLAGLTVLLCFFVCKTEPEASPAPAVTVLEKRVDYTTVLIMSAFLSALSGMVNAVCILEMAMTTAHHTGNASHAGRLAGVDSMRFVAAMAGFWLGALVSGFSSCSGETLYKGRYSAGLLSAAIAVAAGVMIQYAGGRPLVSVPLIAFSQGIPNAVSRKHSALPICTTHMTGYLTDFGSGTGAWLSATVRGVEQPSLRRPGFFGLSVLTFGLGGYAAKKLRDEWGILAALLPAALMAVTSLGLVPLAAPPKKA